MSKNLLRNGDFEMNWGVDKSHRCLIFPVDGESYETDVGNIFTPSGGWVTWFRHDSGTWDQPEVRDAWASHDPRRVHSGQKATLLFSFYRHHDAGFFQRVSVEPGANLRLTAWAHAWSNTNLPGHEDCLDDGRCSCGVGRQVVAIAANNIPDLNGDPWNDAIGNSMFMIGIDPYGGEDPFSANVVWGPAFAIYNGYCHQLVVETEAIGDVATVFLRNVTLYGFKHNDAYFDEVILESIDAPPPPPYESTMLALPQDATPEQLEEIFALAYPDRRTFGFSHDDAGVLGGTAILYNIPDGEKQAYLDFYATRYPDVTVEFAYTSDWVEQPPPPSGLLLWQCDPEWKDEKIAGPDCSLTLCQTGCWISDCAMAQLYYGIKPDATPSTANQALGAVGGFDGCYTTWAGMKEALGLEVVKRSYDNVEAQEWLDTGDILFAEVEPEDFTHFVMVTRYSEGRFWMLDSYKGIEGWVDEYYPGIESWRLIRPFEASPPPPPDSVTLVGLHLQTMVPGALEYIRAAKPRVAKIFQLENAQAIKAASPNTLVVLRYYTPDQNMSGDLAQRAREYVATFESSLRVNAEWIDYVESYNETIPSDNESVIRRSVEFDCYFADALMALGLPVRPVLLNVAVGNPFESEVELLLPAVRKIVEYGGAAGYHGYGLAVAPDGDLNDAWQYYAGRALEGWDPVFRAYGLYPDYFLGEAGAFATCGDGWRSSKCLDGNWDRYLEQLKGFQSRLRSWNVTHGYRCLGAVLFTSGQGVGWDNFQIREAEMKDMAIAL